MVQEPADTNLDTRTVRFYYDETGSATRYAEFYVLNFDGNDPPVADSPARIRVDWTASSGANDPTDVTLKRVKYWNFKGTITETAVR